MGENLLVSAVDRESGGDGPSPSKCFVIVQADSSNAAVRGAGICCITNHSWCVRSTMGCINCDTNGTAYTLRTHVEESDANVDLTFCSTDCLEEWV